MVIYEVNITVDVAIADQYYAWLVEHVPLMLETGLFLSADILQQTDNQEKEKTTFTIIYKLNHLDDLQSYFTHHAEKMRTAGVAAFANQFTASRRVFTVKETFRQ